VRVTFLVQSAHKLGGTERSAVTQANALVAAGHDVRILSVVKAADRPAFAIDDRVVVEHLVDLTTTYDEVLHARESRLVPRRWDKQFSALTDLGLERALRDLATDVLVTVTPALLASAVQLAPDRVVVVHQEHRSSSQRTSGMEPLLVNAPRADVVALLTPTMAEWLRHQLGPVAPEIVSMPNPLPQGFAPRSLLDSRTIVAAGRLVMEKQFTKLVQAFADVADQLPGWRLRILGQGHQRPHLVREVRKHGLWDRVELPGSTTDMTSEWARASISALTSRAEGFPLGLQEAMAAGVPCVSFDCASGPREIVRHEVNGLLVAPESVAGMSAALLRLGSDDDLRRRLGAGAIDTATAWDADAIAAQWVEIFEGAIARRAGRPRYAALSAAPEPAPRPTPAYDAAGVTPSAARAAALSIAAAIAGRVSAAWLVVPPHETGTPVVVMPMAARHRFLQELAAADVPSYLSLRDPAANGWPERRGPVPELASALLRGRTSTLAIEPWPSDPGGGPGHASVLGQGCTVQVEFWEEAVDGQLVAPTRTRYTQRLPRGVSTVSTEVDGRRVPTLPLMAVPTVHECGFPVDVVYTWVDGRDPAWNQARLDRLAGLTGTATTRESSGQARFLSRDELRYSFRSIHLFAPWVRRIHLVTAGQVPDWLDTSHPQVAVVDHADILPPGALPTFNSHAIESAIHNVPDLAEHFVYFNDDFFLGRPLGPETFFSPSGLAAVWLSPTSIGLDDAPGAPPYLKAAWNNRRLLQEAFGAVVTDNLAHAPYPHRRSVLEEIERRFPAEVAATARSPFRSDTDLSMLSSFAQHYGLLTGAAYVTESERAYINISNSDLEWQLQKVLERQQDFLCLADHHDHALNQERLDCMLTEFMATYFPVSAPWERGN
jgi:glycosyltransferase involved in cell wall biosynthesis